VIPQDQINAPQVVYVVPESGCGGNQWIDGYLIGWVFGACVAYFTWTSVFKNR